MTVCVPVHDLSEEIRVRIQHDLKLSSTTEPPIHIKAWRVDNTVDPPLAYLPFAWSVTNALERPARDTFAPANLAFIGLLRDYQEEIRDQTLKTLNRTGSVVLSLHVGWGKSVFALYLAARIKLRVVILVNRIVLAKQWVELICNLFPNASAGILTPQSKQVFDVNVINAQNMEKIAFAHPGFAASVGTVIADEVHLICASKLHKSLSFLRPRYAIALSATPYRPDGLDKLIELYFGTTILQKALERHHKVYVINTGIRVHFTDAAGWHGVLSQQAENEVRNAFIAQLPKMFPERRFLILVKRVAHGTMLRDLLLAENETVATLLENETEFDKTARILIATTSKVGVGFSHDVLDALILATDVREYFIQYLGRVFRRMDTEPLIFDLVDTNPILKRHFIDRQKVYEKIGGTLVTVRGMRSMLNGGF